VTGGPVWHACTGRYHFLENAAALSSSDSVRTSRRFPLKRRKGKRPAAGPVDRRPDKKQRAKQPLSPSGSLAGAASSRTCPLAQVRQQQRPGCVE
jgi:hypothetical protein